MRSVAPLPLLLAAVQAGTSPRVSRRAPAAPSPIRGVNLGSQFIVEPWMASDEWDSMGCGGTNDEWTCVERLGQEDADAAFATHWDTWITRDDVAKIAGLGLNTVRIPVGFWIYEDLVQGGENYPRGGEEYLDRLVGWASEEGLYVIMDLHGGPGSQYPNQQFTGHGVDYPEFYNPENYERAVRWLEWMTDKIHTNENYESVGMLQVMNEPVHGDEFASEAADMVENFYPQAYSRIRDREDELGVSEDDRVLIQFMAEAWGAGDPTTHLPSTDKIAFDDHRYYRWDTSVTTTREGYIDAACGDDRGGSDVIMGEWSVAVDEGVEDNDEFSIRNGSSDEVAEWYRSFWAAQVQAFERSGGWVYWTWKCDWIWGYNEWRWCYQSAVEAGAIPDDAGSAGEIGPC